MNYKSILCLILLFFVFEVGLANAQTVVYIPPGQSLTVKKRVGSTSVLAYPFYDMNDTFPGTVSVTHVEFTQNNYSAYARFELSVSSSVSEGAHISGTVTYQFYNAASELKKEVNFEITIIASEEPADVPPTFSNANFSPASGKKGDTFEFSVVYQDDNGDAPQIVYVQIFDGGYLRGLEMSKVSGDYLTGATYKRSVQILYQNEGIIKHYFESTDFHSNTFRYPETGEFNGPNIVGDETVSTPNTPSGPSTWIVGKSVAFSTANARSNLGHAVEYQFDWGDGKTSTWGRSSQSHTYSSDGQKSVKARARCKSHTNIISSWSNTTAITISYNKLTTLINPQGAGKIERNPDREGYSYHQYVTLTAVAYSGYQFDHWEGPQCGTANPQQITMFNDMTITAHFTAITEIVAKPDKPGGASSGKAGQSLSFSTGGASSNLGHAIEYQFDWGDGNQSSWGSSSRSHSYSSSGTKYVKARARCKSHTNIVSGWSGTKSVSISYCHLSISVNFSSKGSVSKSPNKTDFSYNETVQLTANANAGYHFDHWSGALSGSTKSKTLTMNGNKSVTAYFVNNTDVKSESDKLKIVSDFMLKQNYPNPFNPQTNIPFEIPEPTIVSIVIFNVNGKVVTELFNGFKQSGYYTIPWNASSLPSDIYIVCMKAGSYTQYKKCLLIK